MDRLLICDLDRTLLGDAELRELAARECAAGTR